MYLVDMSILSVAAPSARPGPDFVGLADWLDASSLHLFLSVVTVAEIEDGITRQQVEGATRKAASLSQWLAVVEHLYGARILPIDIEIARLAGRLIATGHAAGAAPGLADAMIAATAKARSLVVLTRNVRHFRPMGVDCLDPYSGLPVAPEGPGNNR